MAGRYRKVFIDSRWRDGGDHNNFSIALPIDVDTTATSSVYVASVSFSNTFETVTSGVNDKLYMLSRRLGNLPSAGILVISPGRYTGATLATEIQDKLAAATLSNIYTVSFNEAYGKISIAPTDGRLIQVPTESELRDASWKAANWDPYATVYQYSTSDPQSLNSILYFSRPSSFQTYATSGNIDLVPYREAYLHSNLTTFRTLKCGTGEQDCISRIPIDADYGFVVVWKHLGPSDAISIPTAQLRNLTFSMRDWAGRLMPVDQPVVIELVFLDSDPYNM